MYLIELRPGTEQFYKTPDEFAAAIRYGEIGAGARIYHRARRRWVSVTLHPHFKAHVSGGVNRAETRSRTSSPGHRVFHYLSQARAEALKRELANAWDRIHPQPRH